MEVWLTKYALNGGLIRAEVESRSPVDDYVYLVGYKWQSFRIGREVFERHDEALNDAAKRRDKKIKSLEKQLAALRALTFNAEPQP